MFLPPPSTYPAGEVSFPDKKPLCKAIKVDTFGGKVQIEWDGSAAFTPLGQLPYFIEFLKLGGRFEPWVADCPLHYTSNNAPKRVNVLGSLLLSVLSGHNRYAHLTALRGDTVNTRLLGMDKIVSDSSAINALKRMDETAAIDWLQTHLYRCYEPLLAYLWILDVDVTVKPPHVLQRHIQEVRRPTRRIKNPQATQTGMKRPHLINRLLFTVLLTLLFQHSGGSLNAFPFLTQRLQHRRHHQTFNISPWRIMRPQLMPLLWVQRPFQQGAEDSRFHILPVTPRRLIQHLNLSPTQL